MKSPKDAVLLRAFVSENDKSGGLPLYEAIVLKAREMRSDGATVLRGPTGFGRSRRIHAAKVVQLVYDLPIVVEMVDSQEKIDAFLPALEQLMSGGIVTTEKIRVLRYGSC
jgi:PII-like signaling protein